MNMRRELVGVSKFLSMVLRHKPETIGLVLDGEGWVSVQMLLDNAEIYQKGNNFEPLTKEILDEVVDTNEKKRFEYSDDGWKIRARQGHSVEVDLKYASTTPPEFLYHGTAKRFLPSIRSKGIGRQKRHHVHLSDNFDTAVSVGKRHGEPHVLRIDSKKMFDNGFDFFKTDNGVWLVDDVPTTYIDFKYQKK